MFSTKSLRHTVFPLSDDKLKRRLIEGILATIQRIKENEIEKLLSKLIFKEFT